MAPERDRLGRAPHRPLLSPRGEAGAGPGSNLRSQLAPPPRRDLAGGPVAAKTRGPAPPLRKQSLRERRDQEADQGSGPRKLFKKKHPRQHQRKPQPDPQDSNQRPQEKTSDLAVNLYLIG